MIKTNLNKILIVGDAGRGKSTLALKISSKLGIQNYSTDDYYYEIKFTKPRSRQESIDSISEIYKKERWIIEGTTKHLIEPGLNAADKIINLKYKNIFIQWIFLLKRYLQRNTETIKGVSKLMKHVFYKKYKLGYRKGKLTTSEFIEPYKHKVITFSSFREINDFINSL